MFLCLAMLAAFDCETKLRDCSVRNESVCHSFIPDRFARSGLLVVTDNSA